MIFKGNGAFLFGLVLLIANYSMAMEQMPNVVKTTPEAAAQYELVSMVMNSDVIKIQSLLTAHENLDLNYWWMGAPLIHIPISQNDLRVTKILIEHSANINLLNNKGEAIALVAAHTVEMIKLLSEHGAIWSLAREGGMPLLNMLIQDTTIDIAEKILVIDELSQHIKIDWCDKDGKTALDAANERGIEEIIALLEFLRRSREGEDLSEETFKHSHGFIRSQNGGDSKAHKK